MTAPIVTHPGKLGDCIYAVPAMRALRKVYKRKLSLAVSPYCAAALSLLMEQIDLLEDFAVDMAYRATADQPGMQPREVTPPGSMRGDEHRDVLHLGLPRHPLQGECLTEVPANILGLKIVPGPFLDAVPLDPKGHVVMHAPLAFCRAGGALDEMMALVPKGASVVIVGTPAEFSAHQRLERDRIAYVTLKQVDDMAGVRDACVGASQFIGVSSGPAAVAAGLGLPSLWYIQAGGDERAIPRGCDVKIVGKAVPRG